MVKGFTVIINFLRRTTWILSCSVCPSSCNILKRTSDSHNVAVIRIEPPNSSQQPRTTVYFSVVILVDLFFSSPVKFVQLIFLFHCNFPGESKIVSEGYC